MKFCPMSSQVTMPVFQNPYENRNSRSIIKMSILKKKTKIQNPCETFYFPCPFYTKLEQQNRSTKPWDQNLGSSLP